jgi:hypothetical protein
MEATFRLIDSIGSRLVLVNRLPGSTKMLYVKVTKATERIAVIVSILLTRCGEIQGAF